MAITKDTTVKFSLGAIVAAAGVVGTAYVTARSALAGEVREIVQQEIKPLGDAFKVLTNTTISSLQNSISALRYKKDTCQPPGCWTLKDQTDLDNAMNQLDAAQRALASLNK